MVRETILSHSHYRVTTFLFSYYSPVTMKTQTEGPHAALHFPTEKRSVLIIDLGKFHKPLDAYTLTILLIYIYITENK